jgi:hypothetical protein
MVGEELIETPSAWGLSETISICFEYSRTSKRPAVLPKEDTKARERYTKYTVNPITQASQATVNSLLIYERIIFGFFLLRRLIFFLTLLSAKS